MKDYLYFMVYFSLWFSVGTAFGMAWVFNNLRRGISIGPDSMNEIEFWAALMVLLLVLSTLTALFTRRLREHP